MFINKELNKWKKKFTAQDFPKLLKGNKGKTAWKNLS